MKTAKRLPSDQVYTDEATLLRRVIEYLEPQERNGVKVIRICDRYNSGYSDLFICCRGQFVIAELKDDTGTASCNQLRFIEEMQRCGAIGGICRSVAEVQRYVDAALSRAESGNDGA